MVERVDSARCIRPSNNTSVSMSGEREMGVIEDGIG